MTLHWFPCSTPFPHITADNYLRQTAKYILTLLQKKMCTTIPSLTYCSRVNNAFIQVDQILKLSTSTPTAPPQSAPDPAPIPIPVETSRVQSPAAIPRVLTHSTPTFLPTIYLNT